MRKNEERDEKIKALRAEGITMKEISERLQLSEATIRNAIHKPTKYEIKKMSDGIMDEWDTITKKVKEMYGDKLAEMPIVGVEWTGKRFGGKKNG